MDTDGDGVPDADDMCPNTSTIFVVDETGCPLSLAPSVSNAPTPLTAHPTTMSPTPTIIYEGEDQTLSGGTSAKNSNTGYSGSGYADMGGSGSYVEFSSVDGGSTGLCSFIFRYANGQTDANNEGVNRPGTVAVNGNIAGTIPFASTFDWATWEDVSIAAPCYIGTNNVVRVTASTGAGGPNIDLMKVTFANTDPTPNPTPAVSRKCT